ncbi:trypsin isoform X1 [Hydra vulgaris]|uniref:trypsin isoform X1 n=1 Tax=Hydra vulgaris TaxID=6087 RepID=UPI001F5F8C84|nr:trypsin isoform X1 [Hydra vulgaris]
MFGNNFLKLCSLHGFLMINIIYMGCSNNEINIGYSAEDQNFKTNKRIIGGINAEKNEFPWQAMLKWNVGKMKDELVCGGSLIDSRFVLTAAHCFIHSMKTEHYYVILGEHLQSENENEQRIDIKTIIIHQNFNEITYNNDIALVELLSPAIINDSVNVISLPAFTNIERPNKMCTVTGWGQTKNQNKAEILQKVNVPIVNFATCNGPLSYKNKLTSNMFCAGYINGNYDACEGDSGSPLQCKNNDGVWLLHGITSWGIGCGKPHKYGVYVIVRHYLAWLKSIIKYETLK